MSKPTGIQQRVIFEMVQEMGYWATSNDIHSPSHATSIERDMFANLPEYDFGDGSYDKALDAVASKMAELHSLVAQLSPRNA